MIECQANYITQCAKKIRKDDLVYIDIKTDVQEKSNKKVQDDNAKSVFATGGCTSWYKTAEGKVTNNWANHTFYYWWNTRRPDFKEFTCRARDEADKAIPSRWAKASPRNRRAKLQNHGLRQNQPPR